MSVFRAALTALRVAQEATDAVGAARATLEAGGGPLAALRAFAAATEGKLDDAALAELEQGVDVALRGLEGVVGAAAWIAAHEPDVQRIVGRVIDVGYKASAWRFTLARWRHEV